MREKIATFLGFSFIGAFVCVFLANAVPPSPPVSGLSSASSVAITGGNITGITTLGATNATLTSANITTTDIDGGAIDGTAIGANSASTGAFTTLSASTNINYILDEDIEAASDTLSVTQCSGGLINNYGQANDVTMTLPAIAKGYSFTVILGTTVAKYYRLDPNANDLIILDGVASTDGKYVGIASAVQGAAITCVAITTGASAYDWACYTISGAWAAE